MQVNIPNQDAFVAVINYEMAKLVISCDQCL